MLNKTDSVPPAFHIIVGTHALWFLWFHIHRRRYFALKALAATYSTVYKIWRLPYRLQMQGSFSYWYKLCVWYWETVTVLLWSEWKDFPPLDSLCCSVSGKRGCSNLHCFACWLMLCLWERCACCEVNSCALQYHCIIPYFLFPLFLLLKLRLEQSSFVGCDVSTCIQCRRVSGVIIEVSEGAWTAFIYQTGKWGSNLSSGNHPAPACIEQLCSEKNVLLGIKYCSLWKGKTKALKSFSISTFSLIA